MHDATALSYVPDTVVVEVDTTAHPYRALTCGDGDEELIIMHVYVEGEWHRRLPDLSATSCEVEYDAQFAPLRREELAGDMCRTCFTSGERNRAAVNTRNNRGSR